MGRPRDRPVLRVVSTTKIAIFGQNGVFDSASTILSERQIVVGEVRLR
jgi:hypothetical protein